MKLPWSEASGAAVGADWLLDAIAPAGAFGRRARQRERAFSPGDEAAAGAALARVDRLARTAEPARLDSIRATLAATPDPGAALVRARSGAVLDDVDFFELSRFLDALAELASAAENPAFGDLPGLRAEPGSRQNSGVRAEPSGRAEPGLRALLEPGRTAARAFYLADAFDPQLARLRGEGASRQQAYDAARSHAAARAARYAGLERIRDGEFVLMREGLAGSLPPEIRVLREAPTYVLCQLALDDAGLAALAARDRAVAAVAEAEEAVRARLSAEVARAAAALEWAGDSLGELDSLVARARFAQRFRCALPQLAGAPEIAFEDARYLPLAAALEWHGRRYAPISLELRGLGVVTGPNMGGKTVALRTLGFLTACVALGVPVPAASARLPLVHEIVWLGLGAAPDTEGLLSSFGSEVVELRAFLRRDPGRALVLVDEFARTTAPRESRALLVALLETLAERGACGLATTHLTGIAADARVPHFAIGGLGAFAATAESSELPELEAALRRIADAMDYRLARVPEDAVPAADAIALAAALGLDRRLIARATTALHSAR